MSVATAILVFAQSVASDAARKRLSAQAATNYCALQLLNKRIRQTACETGLPVLFSTDLIQHSGSFGEQLSEAIQAVFARNFERVLVVGNDCPALTAADLTGTGTELLAGGVALGPDNHGGLYLLGLSREQFDAGKLAQLPWQTNQLYQAIRAYFSTHVVLPLRVLGDINRAADVRAFRTDSNSFKTFLSALLHLINGCAIGCAPMVIRHAGLLDVFRNGPLRAPPFPASNLHF